MKTFDQIWQAYLAKYPNLKADNIVIQVPVHQLREALRLAYDAGVEAGQASVNPANVIPFETFFSGRK